MPTTWDDTKVPAGEIGEYAVVARRSGHQWFLGAINNASPRTLDVPLDFLQPEMAYVARVYADAPEQDSRTRVAIRDIAVRQGDNLKLSLQANGGAAVRVFPKN